MLSQIFISALKLSPTPQWRLAVEAGLHPSTLSKYCIGYLRAKPGDPRLVSIGQRLGLKPEEVFSGPNTPARKVVND